MIFSKLKTTLIAVVISLSSVMLVFAEPMNPTGLWEADDGESRYEVSLCGDGTQLCVKLVWIQPDKIKKANKVYLNTYVVNQARRVTDREWRGKIFVYGHTVSGNVQVFSENRVMVRGCALFVICIRRGLTRMAVAN